MQRGFRPGHVEEGLFYYNKNGVKLFLLLYVNDVPYFSTSQEALNQFDNALKEQFGVKFKTRAKKCFSLEICQTSSISSICQND